MSITLFLDARMFLLILDDKIFRVNYIIISSCFFFTALQHFAEWPSTRPICVHAEAKTTAAVILMAELYKKPIHVCHVARKEEVRL